MNFNLVNEYCFKTCLLAGWSLGMWLVHIGVTYVLYFQFIPCFVFYIDVDLTSIRHGWISHRRRSVLGRYISFVVISTARPLLVYKLIVLQQKTIEGAPALPWATPTLYASSLDCEAVRRHIYLNLVRKTVIHPVLHGLSLLFHLWWSLWQRLHALIRISISNVIRRTHG